MTITLLIQNLKVIFIGLHTAVLSKEVLVFQYVGGDVFRQEAKQH